MPLAFVVELRRLGRAEDSIDFFEVPGAFEIPLQAKLLARTRRYVAIVAAASWSTAASIDMNLSPTR